MSVTGIEASENIVRQIDAVSERAARAALVELGDPSTRRPPDTHCSAALTEVVRIVLRSAFTGSQVDDGALLDAARRAGRPGVATADPLRLYRSALGHAWRILRDITDGEVLLLHAEYFFHCVREGEACIAMVCEDSDDPLPESSQTMALAARAMVEGASVDRLPPTVRTALAPVYLVAVASSAAEGHGGTRATVGHEHLEALRRLTGVTALSVDRPTDTVLLLPVRGSARATQTKLVSAVRAVFLADGNARITCGISAPATRDDIPSAVQEAAELSQVALALGYEAGAYLMEELMLEVMLHRAPDMASRLAARLTPLTRSGSHLIDTLEAFLACDQERKTAAKRLFIHPNTLSYRLRRIQDLTHLSPTSSRDIGVLHAGLIASRIVNTR